LGEFFDEPEPKKTGTTYSIVCETNTLSFIKDLNHQVSQGWRLHGDMVLDNSRHLVQLLVKETEVQF
jgi:hypothetical protein